jgi:predicted nucleic acid-binding protein
MPVSLRAAARWLGANNDAAKRAKRSAALERLRELEQLLRPRSRYRNRRPKHTGSIREELELKGEMIGNNDLWIPSHALVRADAGHQQ